MSDIILSVDGDLRPLESKLSRISSKNISLNLRDSLSQPLGRITGKVSEFEKSLEASNARVLAFGASAGAVYAVQRAFSEVVKSTIQVEKSLTDINVVLNASARDLSAFGKELFGVAKNTGQSFDQVAKAATEFARQGLGIEETLKRTSDALILSRLSGLDAARSVETLTAAVNTFSRAGLTSTQIINKLANVDAAFAVSTGDLAEAISRVGSTAQDVGVDFDQLIAIVTAAQQTTARGGAVIGNSFKTIFTRLQRTDTLDALEGVGIAVKDLQGNTLPAVQILKNLSDVFYTLSDSQRASVAETVGGVFQINILRAALSDLTKEYSVYNGALNTSRSATDQAIQRNEALNQTLSALTNKTFVNLLEAAAKIGEITIAPTIKTGLGGLNAILEEFNRPEELQGTGTKIATGILKGIGSYISGPGLAVVGVAFIKIFGGLTKFSAEALKSLIGISSQADKIAAAQQRVNTILAQNPGLIQAIISKETSLLQVENQILKIIQSQNAARAVGATISSRVAPAAAAMVIPKVSTKTKTKSAGYIPNFVSPSMQEKMGAYAGGYTPGAVKKMGGMYYNTAESVVQFPGADGPAIIPPQNSFAGENYRNTFKKQVGFDPYAYRGYVPNFAPLEANYPEKSGPSSRVSMIYAKKAGIGVGTGIGKYGGYDIPIKFNTAGFSAQRVKKPADVDLEKQLGNYLTRFTNNFAQRIFAGGPAGSSARIGGIEELSNKGSFKSIVGTVFETAVDLAAGKINEGRPQNAPIDFVAPNTLLKRMFGNAPGAYEAKVNNNQDQLNSVAQKMINTGLVSDSLKSAIGLKGKAEGKRRARVKPARFRQASFGHIPNFSALQDAIGREQAAGVNPNLIRVGTSSSLMSRGNPLGLGVYNTKDEPAGLQQGVNRYSGRIPNFAETGGGAAPQVNNLKNAADKGAKNIEKHSTTIGDNQGRLLALGVGLSILQGTLSQVGDQNSKFGKGLNQTVSILSTLTTGLGVFGGGKKGIAATGGMLAVQGVAGLSANADKTFASQMETLDKALENTREQSSKLESVVNSVTPQINAYVEELEKVEPDPAAIAKFKKAILDGVSTLGPELQEQIRNNLESPQAMMGTLSKAQRAGGIAQNQIGLQQLVLSEQGQSRANMGMKGQFGKILAGTGIPGLAGFGQGLMQKEMQPTFQKEGSITKAANTVLEPISQSTEDLLLLADVLSQNSDSASAFFASLEALYQGAGQSTESLMALKEELSKNPEAAKKMVSETLKLTKAQLENAAAASKMGAPTAPGYKGVSKLYGAGMFDEQYQQQPIDDLNNTLSRLAMVSGKGPAAEMLKNRIKGRAALQQAGAGMEVSEEYKKGGASFAAQRMQQTEERYASLLETTGQTEDAKKVRKVIAGTKYDEMGTTAMGEQIAAVQEGIPLRAGMSSVVPPLTEEQRRMQEQAAASATAAKQLEGVTAPTTSDLISTGAGTAAPKTDILNTLLAGGGGLASLIGGGLSLAGGALPLAGKLLGGGANAVRGAGTALGTAGTAAVGSGGAMGVAGTVGLSAAVGYGSYKVGEAIGDKTGATEGLANLLAPLFAKFMGGPNQQEQAQIEEQSNVAQQQSRAIREQKLEQQQAVSEAPTAEVPESQMQEAQKTASTQEAQQNQINNTISVSPSINIAQQAATDKVELQKLIEAEVKKFGETIVKIAEDKAKAREKGVVNPPQKLSLTA